ncbi:MAG: hypothetical protein HY534_00865 [Chloroflexi bacterium]|nr:hypothetical protein [Chloroflexota bacterium]
MATNQQPTETLAGRVSLVRPDGIKLQDPEGAETEWLNVSNCHPLDALPEPGDQVEVVVSRSGRTSKPYITTWSSVIQEPTPIQPSSSSSASPSVSLDITNRDRLMARMSALKSATALGTSQPSEDPLTAAEILATADAFIRWLDR